MGKNEDGASLWYLSWLLLFNSCNLMQIPQPCVVYMHLVILKLPFQAVISPVTPPAFFFKLQHLPDTVRNLYKSTI